MLWVNHQGVDDGRLSAGWTVACGVIAMAASHGAGNLPMTVIALAVTAADLATRTYWQTSTGQQGPQESIPEIRRPAIKKTI